MVKTIRGAITVEKNETTAILEATQALLQEIVEKNKLSSAEIINITFSATTDITEVYPAQAARNMGWTDVPMLCVQEMQVTGSLAKCIRVMMLVDFDDHQDVLHVYLKEARTLRPDLV